MPVLIKKIAVSLVCLLLVTISYSQSDILSLKKQAEKYQSDNNQVQLASTLNKLGAVYWQQGDLKEAIEKDYGQKEKG